jgi:hypothetical protein
VEVSGGFSYFNEVCNPQSVGIATASSAGTAVTCTVNNTKGAFVQLIASTSYDAVEMHIQGILIVAGGIQSAPAFLDIAVGGSGSEVVVINNLPFNNTLSYAGYGEDIFVIPIAIPAGTRISARISAGNFTNTTLNVGIKLFDGGFLNTANVAGVDSLGLTVSTSSGVTMTTSASANTMGAWATIVASTARDYCGIFAAFGAVSNFTVNTLFQVAIGAAASEKVIIPYTSMTLTANIKPTRIVGVIVPVGSRLSAQWQQNASGALGQGIWLYGLYR